MGLVSGFSDFSIIYKVSLSELNVGGEEEEKKEEGFLFGSVEREREI